MDLAFGRRFGKCGGYVAKTCGRQYLVAGRDRVEKLACECVQTRLRRAIHTAALFGLPMAL